MLSSAGYCDGILMDSWVLPAYSLFIQRNLVDTPHPTPVDSG